MLRMTTGWQTGGMRSMTYLTAGAERILDECCNISVLF